MNRKFVLLGSVSAVALAAGAQVAHAQDQMVPEGFTFSVEGGALFGQNTAAEDKLGSAVSGGAVVDIQDNLGYRAAISTGKQIDPYWDLRVTGAINHQLPSSSTFESSSGGFGPFGSGGFGTVETKFDYETLDFEAGYRPTLTENMSVRLFGGVRGLHYNDSLDKVGYYSGGSGLSGGTAIANTAFNSEFFGAGPRLGIEASTQFGDSMFGVSGMLAGGALYGTRRSTAEASIYSGGGGGGITLPPETEEEMVTVYNLEAALGLDMHIDDQTTLTLGYRTEGLFGLAAASGGSGAESTDRWTHGPTIKLTGYFD